MSPPSSLGSDFGDFPHMLRNLLFKHARIAPKGRQFRIQSLSTSFIPVPYTIVNLIFRLRDYKPTSVLIHPISHGGSPPAQHRPDRWIVPGFLRHKPDRRVLHESDILNRLGQMLEPIPSFSLPSSSKAASERLVIPLDHPVRIMTVGWDGNVLDLLGLGPLLEQTRCKINSVVTQQTTRLSAFLDPPLDRANHRARCWVSRRVGMSQTSQVIDQRDDIPEASRSSRQWPDYIHAYQFAC